MPTNTVKNIFEQLVEILKNPDINSALNSVIATEMKVEPNKFKQNQIEKTKNEANMPIDDLMTEIFGNGVDKTTEDYK